MTATEKSVPRTPGRPRKFGQGRRNVMVRFTPERYAELRAEADGQGRSLSEQVEAMIERTVARDTLLAAMGTDDATLAKSVFRKTHVPDHTPWGDRWWPKEHPGAPSTGSFVKPEEEKS
jgi:hypothetical protein